MLSRISNFSGPLSILFKRNLDQNNLILDLQSTFGLSGSTWIDQSSYNNNATFYGSLVTDSINGEIVLLLDGVNDYIFPANGFGNILDTGFTYEVWARTGTSSNGVLLLETGQAATSSLWNDNQMAFVSNKINVGLFDPNDFTPNYITGPTFSVDTWYNIVMTYDGNTLIEYVNGVSVGSSIGVKSNPSSTYLSLGRPGLATNYLGGSTGYFKGYIGTWRIWDGPISGTDILLNYNTNREIYDTFIKNNTILYLDAGSASSYPGSGSVWYDLSVQGNNATMSSTTYSGVNGGYFTFNGLTSKGALTSAKYNVTYSGKTVFVTAYLSSDMTNDTYRAFEGSSAGARNFNFYLHRDSSGNYKLHYSVGLNSFQGGFSNNLASFTPGTWFTVAVTQTTGNLVTYYFNGQPFGTNNSIAFSQYLSSIPPIEIDAIGGADNFWNGRIGLASVYKVALSSSEILQNHNSVKNRYSNFVDTNLVLYFNPNKDLNYPSSISDLSGNSLNGTLSNNTFTAPYLTFNGLSSTITSSDSVLLEPTTGDFSVEVWVNYSVIAGSSRCVLSKTDGPNSADWGYGIRTNSSGLTYMEVGNGTTTLNSPTYTVTTNTWYQIVGVFTNVASNSIALYVNGVNQGTSTSHSFVSVKNTTHALSIGSFDNNIGGYGQWFNGKLGIVRIYNSALSDSDVSKNFEANRDIYGI